MSDRRGFSLAELVVVVLIVSILAAIAQPKLSDVLVKARAADAYSDMQVVRVAAFAFQAAQNTWPPDASRGVVPTGMDAYLPGDFNLTKSDYVLDLRQLGCHALRHRRDPDHLRRHAWPHAPGHAAPAQVELRGQVQLGHQVAKTTST